MMRLKPYERNKCGDRKYKGNERTVKRLVSFSTLCDGGGRFGGHWICRGSQGLVGVVIGPSWSSSCRIRSLTVSNLVEKKKYIQKNTFVDGCRDCHG